MDGREGPVWSIDRKSNAEKYVTTVEAEALAGVYVNRSDRTTVVEHAPFWAAARPGLRRVPGLTQFYAVCDGWGGIAQVVDAGTPRDHVGL